MVKRLLEQGHEVVAFDTSAEARKQAAMQGAKTVDALELLPESLEAPRVIWVMVPHKAVEQVLATLMPTLLEDDIIIDGGNSFYKDSVRRGQDLGRTGIHFLDVGVSGGPSGAREGACLMIGGTRSIFEKLEPVFQDLSVQGGYGYMGGSGAGHFVKMVHNGIEYGMMQAIGEGFSVMQAAPFQLSLKEIARVYNHGSVIESRLIGWLGEAFQEFGEDLEPVSGSVAHTGEGEWTVKTAAEFGVDVSVIKESFRFRVHSHEHPSFGGKVLSALRNRFGGHAIQGDHRDEEESSENSE